MGSPVLLTSSAAGDPTFELLVFGVFALTGIIAVLLALLAEALCRRWSSWVSGGRRINASAPREVLPFIRLRRRA